MLSWGWVQAPHVGVTAGFSLAASFLLSFGRKPSLPSQDSPYGLSQRLCGLLRDEDMTGKSVVSRVLGDEPKISESGESECDLISRQAGTGTPASLRCTHP